MGGADGTGGWLENLDSGNKILSPFAAPIVMSVQDIAVRGDRVILVGSSAENDMMVLGYDRNGNALWNPNPINIGTGRLRGVTTDVNGFIYAVGTSDGTCKPTE